MLQMQSIINIIWIFITAQIKHLLTEQTKTVNIKETFEHILLAVTE